MASRNQYLESLQVEYLASSKVRKGELLTEAEHRTGLNRKYLTRRLSPTTRWLKHPIARGRRPVIYSYDLISPLVKCWDIFNRPCGSRLTVLLKTEIDRLRLFKELWITDVQTIQLKAMSARTIDRLLNHEKEVRHLRERKSEQTNPLLYQLVSTKLSDEADRITPGFEQLDAVEHCGLSAKGEYAISICSVDAASYWWEATAIMGKSERATLGAINLNRRRTPFSYKELHPDNGTNFLNYHLYRYTKQTGLNFSRSRPYKKNDNCFVEQTNSDNVRQYVGHVRYNTVSELKLLNELYLSLRLFKNYFQPVLRLNTKTRSRGHISRTYQPAKTPYQWLLDCSVIPKTVKHQLKTEYATLNPAELKRRIDITLTKLANAYTAKQTTNINHNSNTHKVTFSFGSTTPFRLPTYVA